MDETQTAPAPAPAPAKGPIERLDLIEGILESILAVLDALKKHTNFQG